MRLIVGLMSGTSMDAVDAALCRFDDSRIEILSICSRAYPAPLRAELLELQTAPDRARSLRHWIRLDEAVARSFAETASELMRQAKVEARDVQAIGSHGQTVFHDPAGLGSSWQLGNPSRIAALTGVTTIADFRRADIAHGGQGAPLVPAFHRAAFFHPDEARCVLNVGGIANITTLPTDGTLVRGFDVGPGNALMDAWHERHRRSAYDGNGEWARQGKLHAPLLEALLSEPYFASAPPKSTGRDHFNLDWVRTRYPDLDRLDSGDVQRTLCELTAVTIDAAIRTHAPWARRVLVCGGGGQNRFLMERISALLAPVPVEGTDRHGVDSRWVEAAAFAWLAARTLDREPGNLPSATGARRPVILGGIYQA